MHKNPLRAGALTLACAALAGGCALDSSTTGGEESSEEVTSETRQAWDIEDVYNTAQNTHLWIVESALGLISANKPLASGSSGAYFLTELLNPSSVCGSRMRQGLYDADFLPAYNHGVGQHSNSVMLALEGWWKNGWANHFYDPSTGLNYVGSGPTALTEAALHWSSSKYGAPEYACYELGLALHYMTDVTQPMHASNFTALSHPFLLHKNFETFALGQIGSVGALNWIDVNDSPQGIMHQAAVDAHAHIGSLVQSMSGCELEHFDLGQDCWGYRQAVADEARSALRAGVKYTSNYLLQWLATPHYNGHPATAGSAAASTSSAYLGCRPDEVVVGLRGLRSNGLITQVQAVCAAQGTDGALSAPYQLFPVSDPTFTKAMPSYTSWGADCPSGYAVSKIHVGLPSTTSGLSGLDFACAKVSDTSQSWQSPFWGSGSVNSFAVCGAGEVFRGGFVIGLDASGINRITGGCGTAVHNPAPSRSPLVGQMVSLRSTHNSFMGVTPQDTLYTDADPQHAATVWMVDDAGNNEVFLVGPNHKQLGSTQSGEVYTYSNRQDWERWKVRKDSDGYYVFTSSAFGLNLGVTPSGQFYTGPNAQNWEQWSVLPASFVGKTITLHTAHGTKITALPDGSVTAVADQGRASMWNVEDAGDGQVYLVSAYRMQLSSGDNRTVWQSPNRQSWERWQIAQGAGGEFVITSAAHGLHLGATDTHLVYTHPNRDTWEHFTLPPASFVGQSFGLRSDHGTRVTVAADDSVSAVAGSTATWRMDDAGNGWVFLVGANGKQLGSTPQGAVYTTTNRLQWERWRIDGVQGGVFLLTSVEHGLHLGATPSGGLYTNANTQNWEQWSLTMP